MCIETTYYFGALGPPYYSCSSMQISNVLRSSRVLVNNVQYINQRSGYYLNQLNCSRIWLLSTPAPLQKKIKKEDLIMTVQCLTSSRISVCLRCNILATAKARNLPTRYLLTAHSNKRRAMASSVADAWIKKQICEMKRKHEIQCILA